MAKEAKESIMRNFLPDIFSHRLQSFIFWHQPTKAFCSKLVNAMQSNWSEAVCQPFFRPLAIPPSRLSKIQAPITSHLGPMGSS